MAERPTEAEAERALSNIGARLADGPWLELREGRWAVPARTYMSSMLEGADPEKHRLPPQTLVLEGKRWKVDRAVPRHQAEQQERIFADARKLDPA